MRIALYNLTTTTKSGGIETFNWELGKALAARGHRVDLFGGIGAKARPGQDGLSVRLYPFLARERIPNLGTRFRKFAERLSFALFAVRDLAGGRYDFIYVSKPFDIPAALFSSRMSHARVIYGSGGTEFFPLYGSLVKKVDHFFACSAFNASQIEEYCGVRPRVLYNGVNTDLFRPLPPDETLRSAVGLGRDDFVLMSACRLVGWKGIQFALKALQKILRKGLAVQYVIIGDGEYRGDLEALSVRLGIAERVRFTGSVDNGLLPNYYSLAGAAVFPSIANETFGISIAEAMACGIPVLSTTVGGIPEVVGNAGILLPPADEGVLADALESFIANPDMRKETGARGRERVAQRFGWDVIVNTFENYLGIKG
ncbi:MAG TPA: glycosyltransferase family 4 protein [Dissulfurispiraceae bacterium]|nr:glycosyltransferase family 4 protein [Dissulfurispiraceae bacterium]